MSTLRLGLIGLGNIGRHHATYLLEGRVARCKLTAVCNPTPTKLEPFAAKGLQTFTDPHALIASGAVDAILIATPHYDHAPLGIAALEAGLHVMVEKPIAAHKADAERLLECAGRHPDRVLAGMFQLRVEPRYARIRSLLEEGQLGRIQRVTWINTDWFRTETYYASGGWRATWRGEGGGVLLNQCLHNLDVLSWLFGRPSKVRGFCQFGQWHQIEVEDQVTAWFEYPDGSTGTFLSSTGEAPGTNRLEIAGSRGRLVLENNRLTFTRNTADALEWSRTATVGFSKPDVWNVEIPFTDAPHPHATLVQNFVSAILDGAPLIAPGRDGLGSVELANAIVFSSIRGETLELPLSGAAWEQELKRLITESQFSKQTRTVAAEDFAASFRR